MNMNGVWLFELVDYLKMKNFIFTGRRTWAKASTDIAAMFYFIIEIRAVWVYYTTYWMDTSTGENNFIKSWKSCNLINPCTMLIKCENGEYFTLKDLFNFFIKIWFQCIEPKFPEPTKNLHWRPKKRCKNGLYKTPI